MGRNQLTALVRIAEGYAQMHMHRLRTRGRNANAQKWFEDRRVWASVCVAQRRFTFSAVAGADHTPMEFRMSTNQTNASAGGFLRWNRFVLVNDRVPRANADCALCCRKIEKGYVRESQTRLLYCDMQCFAKHPIAIENRERKVS
jgi:hypothetical protein